MFVTCLTTLIYTYRLIEVNYHPKDSDLVSIYTSQHFPIFVNLLIKIAYYLLYEIAPIFSRVTAAVTGSESMVEVRKMVDSFLMDVRANRQKK